MKNDTVNTRVSSRFSWLITFVSPHKKQIVGLLVLSIFASTLVLVQPLLTKGMIDDGIIAGDFKKLSTIATILLVVGLLSTLVSGVSRYFHTAVSAKVLFGLRDSIYSHLQTLSPSFYARHRRGDLMSRIDGDVAEIQRFAVDGLFAAVSGIFGLIGSIALLFYLSWELTIIALLLLPLEWWYLSKMRPKIERAVRRVREKSADLSAFFIENFSLMKLIQNTGGEGRELNRLSSLNRNYLDYLLNLQLIEFASHAVPSTLTSWSRAAIFLWGGYWVINGSMALGSLIAFSSYLGMAVGPVNTLLGLYLSLGRVKVSLERVEDIIQSPADIQSLDDGSLATLPISGALTVRNLSFTYPFSHQPVLESASVSIPAGAKVGVQSPSGSGKSTLVDLLMRHYDPQSGGIFSGDTDIRKIPLAQWRSQFAVVDQHTALFRASLADNILYANPNASEEELLSAIEMAQLAELVESLANGIDTIVGENGMDLSGGQRQRIALARAMVQKPRFLILDEATSALDTQTESIILAAVDHQFRHCTRLFISHRIQSLSQFDFVLTIEKTKLQLELPSCVIEDH